MNIFWGLVLVEVVCCTVAIILCDYDIDSYISSHEYKRNRAILDQLIAEREVWLARNKLKGEALYYLELAELVMKYDLLDAQDILIKNDVIVDSFVKFWED